MTTTDLERTPLPDHAAHADTTPGMVDLIDAAITAADRQRAELAEAGDLDALAHGLHAAREIAGRLRILIDLIDADVSTLNRNRPDTEQGATIIDGLGALETKRRSTRQVWESERLFGVLIDRITDKAVVDMNTGEMVGDPTTANTIASLLREYLAPALPITPSMGWRIGGLKKAGIDPEDWRERELGTWTTRIITPES